MPPLPLSPTTGSTCSLSSTDCRRCCCACCCVRGCGCGCCCVRGCGCGCCAAVAARSCVPLLRPEAAGPEAAPPLAATTGGPGILGRMLWMSWSLPRVSTYFCRGARDWEDGGRGAGGDGRGWGAASGPAADLAAASPPAASCTCLHQHHRLARKAAFSPDLRGFLGASPGRGRGARLRAAVPARAGGRGKGSSYACPGPNHATPKPRSVSVQYSCSRGQRSSPSESRCAASMVVGAWQRGAAGAAHEPHRPPRSSVQPVLQLPVRP